MSAGNILVVDNEDDQLQLLRSVLLRLGYSVTLAASAETALRCLRETPVDAVFTDLIMPGMDGTELCERIRNEAAGTVVIATSGHIHLFEEAKLRRAGFDGFIRKPYRISDIEDAARNALSLRSQRGASAPETSTPM